LTEVEKALKECEWQEFTSPEGKKYYSHKTTKESKWEMPEEYNGKRAHSHHISCQ
jgi:pre-mRNA-processing factor 40